MDFVSVSLTSASVGLSASVSFVESVPFFRHSVFLSFGSVGDNGDGGGVNGLCGVAESLLMLTFSLNELFET